MKKTLFFIALSLTCISFVKAQEIVITNGAKIKVASGASLNVNGLVLQPTNSFDFTENTITKSSTAIVVNQNESMDRVYTFSNSVTSFEGTIIFYYEDSDENGIADSDAVLELNQNGTWINYPDSDDLENKVTSTLDNAVSFSQVTSSSSSATLVVDSISEQIVRVFPNPAVNNIQIINNEAFEATLFNQLGQEILRTNQKNVDVSSLAKGLYILKINNINNSNSNNFKIIKK